MDTNPVESYSTLKESSGTKWWVWALVIVGVCCCLTVLGTVGVLAYFGREPENVTVEYDMPPVVTKGENFDLVLTVTNNGNETITVNDVDLDEAFGGSILDGSIVMDTEPTMERDYSLEGIKTFAYNRPIEPGQSATIIFHLQATTLGEFGGSMSVYVGNISKRIEYVGLIVKE